MEQLFSIGDVAKLFHLSVSSLRHYEALGLLTPERVDPNTGYRSYSIRQFEVLNTIRYLRALDMPLEEIADFLRDRDVERIEEKLSRQREAVLQRQRELERIRRKIDNRLHQLREARTAVLDSAELICAPACRMVWMADRLRPRSFLDMEASIRRLEGPNTGGAGLSRQGGCVHFGRSTCAGRNFRSTMAASFCWTGRITTMGRSSHCRRPSACGSAFGAVTGTPRRATGS